MSIKGSLWSRWFRNVPKSREATSQSQLKASSRTKTVPQPLTLSKLCKATPQSTLLWLMEPVELELRSPPANLKHQAPLPLNLRPLTAVITSWRVQATNSPSVMVLVLSLEENSLELIETNSILTRVSYQPSFPGYGRISQILLTIIVITGKPFKPWILPRSSIFKE